MRSGIQHFAAGVVFGAVAGELLPEIREQNPIAVIIGFTVGVGLMLAIRHFVGHGAEGGAIGTGEDESPTSFVLTVGVDIVIDGLLVGVGFAAGALIGRLRIGNWCSSFPVLVPLRVAPPKDRPAAAEVLCYCSAYGGDDPHGDADHGAMQNEPRAVVP